MFTSRIWDRLLPGDNNKVLRENLNKHLAIALKENIAPPKMDEAQVERARNILINTPLEQRVYRRIKNDFLSKNKSDFNVHFFTFAIYT